MFIVIEWLKSGRQGVQNICARVDRGSGNPASFGTAGGVTGRTELGCLARFCHNVGVSCAFDVQNAIIFTV